MKNLHPDEFAEYYTNYINQVKCLDIVDALQQDLVDMQSFLETIPFDKYKYKYLPEKWSVQEVLQHIIDAERIFAYRALRFARFDKTPLATFEEDDYVKFCDADHREMKDIVEEFILVRKSTIKLFESFSDEMLLQRGIASGVTMSVRALGYIITGHCIHHSSVIKERYLEIKK